MPLFPKCGWCENPITDSVEVHLFEGAEPMGIYHRCCADAAKVEYGFTEEPEPREPDDDDYNRRMEMAADAAARYAQELRDAGRRHLLP